MSLLFKFIQGDSRVLMNFDKYVMSGMLTMLYKIKIQGISRVIMSPAE
jgi:hypothetical protein